MSFQDVPSVDRLARTIERVARFFGFIWLREIYVDPDEADKKLEELWKLANPERK